MHAFDPIGFLQTIVRLPSPDPPGGELPVAEAVHGALQGLGIETTIDVFAPGRANVLGRIPGRGAKAPLVFSAHMDTVPAGQQPWDFPPFAGDLVGGHVRGRGTSDMKGAIAAFLAAAAGLAARPEPLAGDILLAFTAGESASCLGARRLVQQGFRDRIGAFLCGEPSSLDIIAAEQAVLWIEAVAEGRSGHVSGDPGENAIELMADALHALRGIRIEAPAHPLLGPPTVRVGRIEGGSAVNITPDRCRAEIDVRIGPGVTPDAVIARLGQVLPAGVRLAEIDFKPAVVTDPDSPFVRTCARAAAAERGCAPSISGVAYYSDAAVLLDGLDVPFAILGPGTVGMSGQPNETVPAANIPAAARIYRAIAEDWLA